jgi:DNA-binding FadR family transcriptional regulator
VAGIHDSILQAIAARDPALARERMLDHLAALSGAGRPHAAARLVASV